MSDIESQAEMDLHRNKGLRKIEDIVTQINTNVDELINFSYHLRKTDIDDKYSLKFLDGAVKPQVMVDIILSNKWN